MSLRALSRTAVERETESGPRRVKAPRERTDAEGVIETLPDPLTEPHSYADALVSAIPTEVLALYTFVITEIVGTITSDNDDKHLWMRWILYGVSIAAICVYLYGKYQRNAPRAR